MDAHNQPIAALFVDRFGAQAADFRGELTLTLPADQAPAAALAARDELGYNLLLTATAVDYWPQQSPRFHVIYQLRSLKTNCVLRLCIPLNGNAPVMPTLEGIYPNANWKEREIWDMFGIRFEGHSDLRRIILPADWEGHPLRKDYPLGYEEPQFTFNFDEIRLHKPRGEE